MTSLAISGQRESGQDVRTANVTACVAVANILRSSLGPQGLDKMLVDQVGDVTVTNDGATIVGLLEVEHPAARILTELAQQQDQEVGDGTTSVVILAAELLKRANDLVQDKIHPTNIIGGYRLAIREACKYVRERMVCWGTRAAVGVRNRRCLLMGGRVCTSCLCLASGLWRSCVFHFSMASLCVCVSATDTAVVL